MRLAMATTGLTNAVSTGLAALAAMLQVMLVLIGVVALLSLRWAPARRLLIEVRDTLLGGEIWAAWIVALVAMSGSLYFSQIADFIPCELCWFQRIMMYPMVVILLVGALRKDVRAAVQYAFVFPIIGIGVATYQIYIELNPSAEPSACRVGGTSCATEWIKKFGYITIPVLSITAFTTILTLLIMAWSRRPMSEHDAAA